jgi:hypothetical protein
VVDAIGPGIGGFAIGIRCARSWCTAAPVVRSADAWVKVPGLDDAEVVALILNYVSRTRRSIEAQLAPGSTAL